MIITGVSLAKMPLIEVFKDIKMYQFTFLKMLVIPMIRSICDPAVSFRSCSLGDHGINVWNAKWKHGSDDGNRLWIRQFHLHAEESY